MGFLGSGSGFSSILDLGLFPGYWMVGFQGSDRSGFLRMGFSLVFSGSGSTGFPRSVLVFQRVGVFRINFPSVSSFMAFQWLLKVSRSES